MKAKRVFLPILLALCLVFSILTGCASKPGTDSDTSQGTDTETGKDTKSSETPPQEEKKEPVTLAWWYRGNGEQADTAKVEDKVNEMLKSYKGLEHVSIDLNCYAASDYATQVTLAQTAGKQMDILNTVTISFTEQVKNGTYIPLDDYLAEMPELTDTLPEWLLDLGKIDGVTYMIPHYQQAANMPGITTPKKYLDQYGDEEKIRKTVNNPDSTIAEKAEVLKEYLLAVREGEGETKYAPRLAFLNEPYYDDLYYNTPVPIRIYEGTTEAVYAPLSDLYKEAYEMAAKWYTEGLVHPDPTIDYETTLVKKNMLNDVSAAFDGNHFIGSEDYASAKMSKQYGFDVVAIATKDHYYINNYWAAGGDGVTASSQHPEEAIKFIEAMNIERGKEIYNTIVYGIEGVHYEKIDDTHIKTLGYDGSQGGSDYLYSAHKWIMGNTFNAWFNQGSSEEDLKIAKEINESPDTVASSLMGLVLDTEPITTELSQIAAVHTEYKDALEYGNMGDGWEAYYEEYKDKIQKAGIEKVLKVIQEQIDEFVAKNK